MGKSFVNKKTKNYEYYKNNLITRINYAYFFEGVFDTSGKSRNLLLCFLSFFKLCISYLFKRFNVKSPKVNNIIFFSTTQNNNKALESVWCKIDKKDYILWLDDDVIPQTIICLLSGLYILSFLKMYFHLDKHDRNLVRFMFNEFVRTKSTYLYLNRFLKKNKNLIKVVVMANDHSMPNRCLIETCRNNGIKTVYVQHASVSPFFPPLNFDYSFLDGFNSYNIYNTIQSITNNCIISGNPRYDGIKKICKSKTNALIGIATNTLDKDDKIMKLCLFLKKNVKSNIILRPHPAADYSDEFKKVVIENGFLLSDSKKESSLDFLSRIDFLISNESSIHLDSVLVDTPSCMFNFSDKEILDIYDFIKTGFVKKCDSEFDVLESIKKINQIEVAKVRYFVADFKTKYSGNVASIISGFIKKLAKNEDFESYLSTIFIKKNNLYTYRYEN